jgi:hypothetical protein
MTNSTHDGEMAAAEPAAIASNVEGALTIARPKVWPLVGDALSLAGWLAIAWVALRAFQGPAAGAPLGQLAHSLQSWNYYLFRVLAVLGSIVLGIWLLKWSWQRTSEGESGSGSMLSAILGWSALAGPLLVGLQAKSAALAPGWGVYVFYIGGGLSLVFAWVILWCSRQTSQIPKWRSTARFVGIIPLVLAVASWLGMFSQGIVSVVVQGWAVPWPQQERIMSVLFALGGVVTFFGLLVLLFFVPFLYEE